MKYLLAILLVLIPIFAHAIEGVVLVLEAPLLDAPSLDAGVKQMVRRGEKVYLHEKHFNASPWESTSQASERIKIVDSVYDEEFYQTISKDGLPAYIQAKYVKVIYQDIREENDPVARFKVDPTDYRLQEPLPEDYPLSAHEKSKALALFSMGTNSKSSYPFAAAITDESYHQSLGVQLIYASKVDYDLFDRFYFGAKFGFDNNDVDLAFADGSSVKQSLGRFNAGPYIAYDIYKTKNTRLSAYASIALTYYRAFLTYKGLNEYEEERAFSAWGLTPEIGSQWQWINIFPKIDLVLGAQVIAQPSVALNSSSAGEGPFWNEEQDTLSMDAGLRAMFVLGIQSRY